MPTLASHLALALSIHAAIARLFHSLPEDTYAFPKFRVAFLNSLPVLNETAERWLSDGLLGGEVEFLEQPRKFSFSTPSEPKGIESGHLQGEAEVIDVGVLETCRKMYLSTLLLGFDHARRFHP
jgi:protein OS-9